MSQKVAYVTGGMGGIGTAICQRLAKDGFKVIAGCGPNSPRKDRWLGEQKALGYDFIASEGNVSDWDSTVEAFNSKVVRSSAGSMFYIPVFEDITIDEVKEAGFSIVGTSSHEQRGSVPFTQASLAGKIAIVVGNEAHGMDDAHLVDQWITIPHRGRSESLNVAMAATVVCFEVAHQRDNAN